MSNVFDDYDFEGEFEDNEEPEYPNEASPAEIAYLDQEQADFEAHMDEWFNQYGFYHKCRCSQDAAEGRVGLVPVCFMRLTEEALDRCAIATNEIRVYTRMLDEMMVINKDLVQMLEERGFSEDLERYFNETIDIEAEEFEQLSIEDSVHSTTDEPSEDGPVEIEDEGDADE